MNDRGGLKRAVETESAKEYAKQLIRLEADKPQMWGEIEKHMSVESKAPVKLDVEYKNTKQSITCCRYGDLSSKYIARKPES